MNLVALIEEALKDSHTHQRARAIFGSVQPEIISAQIDEHLSYCERSPRTALSFSAKENAKILLALDDGTHVLVKVHGSHEQSAHLHACYNAQRALAKDGLKLSNGKRAGVPQIIGPVRDTFGRVMVVQEERAFSVERLARTHLRQIMARELQAFCQALSERTLPFGVENDFERDLPETHVRAHQKALDLALSILSKSEAQSTLIGHRAFTQEHVVVDGDEARASWITGFDKLAHCEESALLAVSACSFSDREGSVQTPALDDIHAFVVDYESARGAAFSKEEMQRLHAHLVITFVQRAAKGDASADDRLREFMRT